MDGMTRGGQRTLARLQDVRSKRQSAVRLPVGVRRFNDQRNHVEPERVGNRLQLSKFPRRRLASGPGCALFWVQEVADRPRRELCSLAERGFRQPSLIHVPA